MQTAVARLDRKIARRDAGESYPVHRRGFRPDIFEQRRREWHLRRAASERWRRRRRREQELDARFLAWLAARPDQRDRYEAASTELAEHVKQALGFAMDGASVYVHLDMDTDELYGPWLRMLAVRKAWPRDEAGS